LFKYVSTGLFQISVYFRSLTSSFIFKYFRSTFSLQPPARQHARVIRSEIRISIGEIFPVISSHNQYVYLIIILFAG